MTITDGKLLISRDEDDYEIIARHYPKWQDLHVGVLMREDDNGLEFLRTIAHYEIDWKIWHSDLMGFVRNHKRLHDIKAKGIIVGSDTSSLSTVGLSIDDPTGDGRLLNITIEGPNYLEFKLGKLTLTDVVDLGQFFTKYAKELRDAN